MKENLGFYLLDLKGPVQRDFVGAGYGKVEVGMRMS